jgi:hypothetical protein
MVKSQPPQIGGVQEQMSDLLSKYGPPVQTILVLGIFLGIVFLPKLPSQVKEVSDAFYGRLAHSALLYYVTANFGWTVGIVFAVFSALLIGAGSHQRLPVKEGFNSDIKIIEPKHKWFVEKVLGENPLLIEEENILTYPVQDSNRRGTGSYGGNVQNTSVSM